MIDYHCHLLPGLDDGAKSLDESLEMARALVEFGFREVCCTPHCIKGHFELSPVEVRDAVRHLQSGLDREGIPLLLRPGMEYYLDEFFEQFAANLLPLGGSRLVLCEAPHQALPGLVNEMLDLIVVQGYLPLVAHPERSEVIWGMLGNRELDSGDWGGDQPASTRPAAVDGPQAAPSTSLLGRLFSRWAAPRQPPAPGQESPATGAEDLPEACLFQANLGSFVGFYGATPQRRAYDLLQRGRYACFASDLHDPAAAVKIMETAREKLAFNPALQRLAAFRAPEGQGGSDQLAFW